MPFVVLAEKLAHQRGRRVREQGRSDLHTEHKVAVDPRATGDSPFSLLTLAMLSQDVGRVTVDADQSFSASFGRPLDAAPVDDAHRAPDANARRLV